MQTRVPGASSHASPPGSATILVADDNRDAADTMGLLLQMSGHEVWVAHTGGQALDTCRRQRPDIAILDIGMPDMNGYEVARTIRSEPESREIILVAVTGWGQPEDKDRARAAGFDRHLTKPIDPDAVEELVRSLLAAKRSQPASGA